MDYIHKYKNDIFISYTHLDNRPLPDYNKGWISYFQDILSIYLADHLGREAQIWRDIKTQGNDDISKLFFEEILKTAAFICILSPHYLESCWCSRELHEFCDKCCKKKIFINRKSRVFKVIKTYIPEDKHPRELQTLIGYKFYEIDKQTGKPHTYRPELGGEEATKFIAKVEDLAIDISKLVEMMKKNGIAIETALPDKTSPIIFLAQTTSDLNHERDKIFRELQQHGYTIFPEGELPLNIPEFQNKVDEYLNQSQISIHLIGERYGVVPEGETRSIIDLQYELATKKCMTNGFKRLVWIPQGLQVKEQRQKDFIAYLENDPNALQGAELFKTSIEEFKTNINTIIRNGKLLKKKYKIEEAPINIYIICDQRDINIVESLKEFLFNKGYEVITPLFQGEEHEIREDHKENLSMCDAIIIFCNNSNESWLRSKLRELKKIRGYPDFRPKLVKAIFIGAPVTAWKEQFRTLEASVIKNFNRFIPEFLRPFLIEIEKVRE